MTLAVKVALNPNTTNQHEIVGFKFDENGKKFSKRVENTVGKGEIARYEQFFFFHTVFKRHVHCDRHVKSSACLGKG